MVFCCVLFFHLSRLASFQANVIMTSSLHEFAQFPFKVIQAVAILWQQILQINYVLCARALINTLEYNSITREFMIH